MASWKLTPRLFQHGRRSGALAGQLYVAAKKAKVAPARSQNLKNLEIDNGDANWFILNQLKIQPHNRRFLAGNETCHELPHTSSRPERNHTTIRGMAQPSDRILWHPAVTIFLGAVLLFQVQPIISKTILPWFGGSPAVWTTCMLFFQVALLAGYAYAHGLSRLKIRKWIVAIHVTLLVVAALSLIVRAEWFRPENSQNPAGQILVLLAASVGLPYLMLATTGPLVQFWVAQATGNQSPYRLYALSNVGSFAALLSYPFLIEPLFTTRSQILIWSWLFVVYSLLCGTLAFSLTRNENPSEQSKSQDTTNKSKKRETSVKGIHIVLWFVLPAFASVVLLSVTNHLCQNVAVIPFLWIAPLSLYLLSFIICFDSERWYVRPLFAGGTIVVVVLICQLMLANYLAASGEASEVASQYESLSEFGKNILVQIALYLSLLFFVCMVCHGEVARIKPDAKYLTGFYLAIAAGGAIGGLVVAIICPIAFSTYWEMNLGIIGSFTIAAVVVILHGTSAWLPLIKEMHRRRQIQAIAWIAATIGIVVVVWAQMVQTESKPLLQSRSFYGLLSVKERAYGRALYSGDTMHGFQFDINDSRRTPTIYYAQGSGVAIALSHFPRKTGLRVGAVGLGAGTIAAHSKDKNDYYCFYEINPHVEKIARKHFTFLSDSPAKIDVLLGDGRLAMEQQLDEEGSQQYDVLVLDAFSGDTIPTHLLTDEAFAVYRRHLREHNEGVIAFHVSNRYLNLVPVVERLARHHGMKSTIVSQYQGDTPSDWILATNNEQFLDDPAVKKASRRLPQLDSLLWTDQYSNLIQLLWQGQTWQ